MSASLTATPGGAPPGPPGGAPPTPGGAHPPGAPQPPIGGSSATGPSQNLGATAQANQIAAALLQLATMALTKAPPGTPMFNIIAKFVQELGKEVQPGASSPAGVSNAMKSAALQHARMAPQIGAQQTQAGAPGGAPPKPPMPVAA